MLYVILSLEQSLISKAHKEDHFFTRKEFRNGLSYCFVVYLLRGRRGLCVNASQVATIASIDLDNLTLIDEQWYTNDCSCLKCCRLSCIRCSVTLYTWLTVSDSKRCLNRHFCKKDCAIRGISNNLNNVTFFHIVRTCNLVLRDRNLLKSFLIHEDVTSCILIKVLIWATFNAYILELETYLECALKYSTISNILQFGNHDGVTFTWLTMLEVDTSPNLAIKTDASSNLNLL